MLSIITELNESQGLNTPECHDTKIVQTLTCVKGGHMKGPEPQFWMCEYPVEKNSSLHGYNCTL